MNDEARAMKYEVMVKNIMSAAGKTASTKPNTTLGLIFDYHSLNAYGKAIICHSDDAHSDFADKYSIQSLNKDLNHRLNVGKEFIRSCDKCRKDAYYFIFWALLVLTVDQTDAQARLSAICDYAQKLRLTENDVLSILQVIQVIYGKAPNDVQLKSEAVQEYFSGVVARYLKNKSC